MSREITRRETLLDCLEMMRMRLKVVSVDRKGRIPIDGEEDLFFERQKKCCIIQNLIQANESEPVRSALAEWKTRLTKGEKKNNDDMRTPA